MVVDLRSDTVTRPTEQMLQAMVAAELGDNVLGDDPTVQRLERMVAELLGKEAALFVPSGTMGNEIAIMAHTRPGDAILLDDQCHILHYELGGPAALAGVLTHTTPCVNGRIEAADMAQRIYKADDHTAGTALLCIENSHMRTGGIPVPTEHMRILAETAHARGVKVHVDGARLFNAATALGVSARELVADVDSVMFCLSKGLACPVGSMLAGTTEFIRSAHRIRKLLGGGMRQVGILAAAGIVALDSMITRLADDHRRASELARGIARAPGFMVNTDAVCTNIVFVTTEKPATETERELTDRNVLALALDSHRLRLVTHKDVNDSGVEQAIAAFHSIG